MSPTESLRTRIAEISSAITQQQAVLKDLERTRFNMWRQLNAMLDPISRLPVEISSDIFMRCLPDACPGQSFDRYCKCQPSETQAPMLLLGICTAWSNIALSTPPLWASIHVRIPKNVHFHQLFDIWLNRARGRPLSIALYAKFLDDEICNNMHRRADQVHELRVALSVQNLRQLIQSTPFPALKNLTIRTIDEDHYYSEDVLDWDHVDIALDLTELMEMLRSSPGLVSCKLDGMRRPLDDSDTLEPVVLPSMQYISLTSHSILNHLTLPALQVLMIPRLSISMQAFASFLDRSSPPLRELSVSCGSDHWATTEGWSADELVQLLGRMSGLDTLNITGSRHHGPLFDALKSSPTGFLPKLRSLTIVADTSSAVDRSSYVTLLDVLAARYSQMRHFRFEWHTTSYTPRPEIISRLRQFVADGMCIHIGRDQMNLIQPRVEPIKLSTHIRF